MGTYTEGNDEELAAVMAHELAHNILRHVARSQEAGTPNNYTRYLNRYSRISRKMEEEADRLSVWILQIAGYEPSAPVTFWHRFGPNNDSAHPYGRLHDPWRVRVAALEDELGVMREAQATNPQARPALLDLRNVVPVFGQP
jgi:predicted Zn-dependent protease